MRSFSELSLAWNTCTQSDWDVLLRQVGRSPLEQSWAYGEAMTCHYGQTTDRIVIRDGDEAVAILQVFHKRLMGFASIVRILRGPLFLGNPTETLRFETYRAIHAVYSFRLWEIPLWLPETRDEPESHVLMRRIGTRRMVTGLSSAWFDLSAHNETMHGQMTGSWRNALRAAEKSNISVTPENDPQALPDLMCDYDAFRRGKRFVGPPGPFITAMNSVGGPVRNVIALSAKAEGKRIAGIVLIRHGVSATYYVSWTGDEGRRRRAHNLLLWHGIRELRDTGTKWLDLGGLNTDKAAGIARFKLGLRPEIFTLAGTYL